MARRELPVYASVPLAGLLLALASACAPLPRRLELALGRAFGRAVLRLGLFKRKVAEANLRRCFPELDAAARARLLLANFEHYGMLFFETLHFFSPWRGHYRRYVAGISRLEGHEHWRRAHARGKGVIFFSAHLGCWEAAGASIGLAGIDATVVTTVLTPRWLHDAITAGRRSFGVAAAYHPGSMPAVLRALRRGGSVVFMNDQYAGAPMGVKVRFFGAETGTLAVVGSLAKRTGAAVLPIYARREPDGTAIARIEPELDLSALAGPTEATQAIATHVEAWVRRWPEQWLWMHRRFKDAPLPA